MNALLRFVALHGKSELSRMKQMQNFEIFMI